uniref:Uncharacterized protein n=1 Tax=Tanacetum cinerariifolium TaxID=118510 RepID=A0A6L2LQC2_TANCI|nr:hypothetical protein [Tanacetum cinerariifolium]
MDDPNITMDKYIKLQAKKAQRRDFKADFPAIVYNDASTSYENVSSKPTISIYNAIKTDFDFSISFFDSDDEDYTFICDKDSFSYKLIPVDNLKPKPIWMDYYLELRGIYGSNTRLRGLTEETRQDLTDRINDTEMGLDIADTLCFQLGGARRSMTWRQFILALGLHATEEMNGDGFEAYWGSKRGARLSGRHFVRRLAEHFRLVTEEGLQGLVVVVGELMMIDMDDLVRLRICERLGDTWAWVTLGPDRQLVVVARAPENVEGAHAEDEGVQADPTPVQAPKLPPAAVQSRTMTQRMARLEEEVYGLRERVWTSSERSWTRWPETFIGLPCV